MNTQQILTQFLTDNKLMQLATQDNGKLWICNVYFVIDEEQNIYWTSSRSRRHSKEIEANPNVAVTIVNDPEKKQAVQISGTAERVSLGNSEEINRLYGEKFGFKQSRLDEVLEDTDSSRAYWKLTPTTIELWDEVNFPGDHKQKIA